MTMTVEFSPKVLRRLIAAEGYLELGMPVHALTELDGIDDAGPFEPPLQFMRGEALKAQERYDDAIGPLQKAAKLIPAPHNKQAWLSLSECFRHRGQHELADAVEKFAKTPPPKGTKPGPVLSINIIFKKSKPAGGEHSGAH